MINDIEYFECEKNDKRYNLCFLDELQYKKIKSDFEFKEYLNDFGFEAYLIRDKEVIVVDESIHSYDIYKSIGDFETYLDLAYREKVNESQDKLKRNFKHGCYVNDQAKIITYKYYTKEGFIAEFNDDPANLLIAENKIFRNETGFYFSFYSSFSTIFCFDAEEELIEFMGQEGKSVFININPYGFSLFDNTERLINDLSKKLNIDLEKLDYSKGSLGEIDRAIWNKEDFSEKEFYEIYLQLTLYLGLCLDKNFDDLQLKLVSNEGVIEPVIINLVSDEKKYLSIYIYENYINESDVILSLYYLYGTLTMS